MADVIVVNRGKRSYTLRKGPNGEERVLPPGGSIETLDAEEAKQLLRYHDLQDIAKAAPQTAARIKEQQEEIARLRSENEKLRPAAEPPKEEKHPAHASVERTPSPAKKVSHRKGH